MSQAIAIGSPEHKLHLEGVKADEEAAKKAKAETKEPAKEETKKTDK